MSDGNKSLEREMPGTAWRWSLITPRKAKIHCNPLNVSRDLMITLTGIVFRDSKECQKRLKSN
jgi:hypothetical protein